MATPLHDLQHLVANRRTVTGRVVTVTGGMMRVATPSGVVEVAAEGTIQVGDLVMVHNGRTSKRQHGAERIFFV